MQKAFQFLKKALFSGVKALNSMINDIISPTMLILFWALSEGVYLCAILNSFYFTFKIKNQAGAYVSKALNFFTLAIYRQLQSSRNTFEIPPLQYIIPAITILIITSLPFIAKIAISKQSLGSISKALLIIFVIILFLSNLFVFYLLETSLDSFQESLTLQGLLNISNASLFVAIIYCFQKLGREVHYHSEYSTLATYNQSNPLIKIIKILLSVALTKSNTLSSSIQVWLLILLSLVLLYEIKCLLSYRKYMSAMLQKIYEFILVTQLASLSLILICHAGFGDIASNFEATLLVIIGFTMRSLAGFQKWRRSKLIGKSSQPTEVSAVSEVLEMIRTLKLEDGILSQQNQLTRACLFENHRIICEDPSCSCKIGDSDVNPEMTNIIIKEIFQENLAKLPSSHSLRLIHLGFNAKEHSSVLTTLIALQRFIQRTEKQKLSFDDSMIIQKIFDSLASKFTYDKDSLLWNVKCEHIFEEEALKKGLQSLLIDILNDFISKYKYLSSEAYHLNVVEEHSERICKKICAIAQEWLRFKSMDSSNHEIYQIFIFYHFNVLPTVIEGKAIALEIVKKFEKMSMTRGLGKETIHSRLYSKNTCIVESNIQDSFGVISNISASSAEIFGLRNQSLIGKHINTIMPAYFSKAHDGAIAEWVNNFRLSDSQKEIVEFGYIDTKLVCFQGSLLMKVCAKLNEVFFYTMIIRENDQDYLLLNSKKVIEGVGKRLITKRLFEVQSVSLPASDFFEFNFDQKLAENTKIKTWLNLESSISFSSQEDDGLDSKKEVVRSLFVCSATISKLRIYNEHYFLIKFEEIIRCSNSLVKLQDNRMKDTSQYKIQPWEVQSYQRTKAEQILDLEEYDSVQPHKDRILNTRIMGEQSHTSSVSISGGQSSSKLLFTMKSFLIHPERIKLGYFKSVTIWLFFCGVLVIGFFYGLETIFSSGFGSFNDVMFGDGAVSDNNQIYEILYNNILMGRIYCKEEESARCTYLKKNTAAVSNILYQLYVDDLEVYLKNSSMLTRTKFYESYEIEVPFRVGEVSTNVKTLQFMEYYYYAIRKSYILITQGRERSEEGEQTMSILYDNWEAMKYINHIAIYFYMDVGEQELNILLALVLALAFLLLCLIVAIFLISLKFNRYVSSKKYSIISLHLSIDRQTVLEMLDYYGFLIDIVRSHKFKTPQFFNSDENIKLGNRMMPYSTEKSKIVPVIVLLIVILLFAGIEIGEIAVLLPSCKKMVKLINDLMDTENFLLENYFEMKTYYMAYNYSKSVEQITMEISAHLNQSEPIFTSKAKDSLNIFANTDPTFVTEFNSLLVDDICSLTALVFESWQVDYCRLNFTSSVMELGLVNSMVFFQRNAYSALMELYSRQKESLNKVAYFTSDVFRDIDDSLFYMFRLYQATQARMYESLNYSISTSLVLLKLVNALSVAAICGSIIWWLAGYRRTQKDLKNLYGVVLQLPEGLISNKEVKTCIIENLQIQQ